MDFNTALNRYADLIVSHGARVQPGQKVLIGTEVCHRELAFLIASRAYAVGAAHVILELEEPRMARVRLESSTEEMLEYTPSYLGPKFEELVTDIGAVIRILGPEDPDLLLTQDPRKVNVARMARYNAVKHFYDEGIKKSRVHWTLAAAATPAWGAKVYPEMESSEAERALWKDIFAFCRLDREDYLAAWEEHDQVLNARAEKLNDLKIDSVHFSGPGTDLTVGLSRASIFKGGGDQSPRGVHFEPNIPTEECFTTPDYRRTSGRVAATRPIFVNGNLIRGLWLEFSEGKIADFGCSSGQDTFAEYIDSDEGARRLGELALVGIDSPIFQTGRVYQEILFDENAACHIALGSAYKFCVKGGDSMSEEELAEIGFNESSVHTDLMISSEEVDVVAKTSSGEEVPLLTRGEWVGF